MAMAVRNTVISSRSLACSRSNSSKQQTWQEKSQKLRLRRGILGGGSVHCLQRAAAKKAHQEKIGTRQSGYGGPARAAYKKRPSIPVDDPFDFGEDEDMENGELMSRGKQSPGLPRPANSTTNEDGFLEFPPGYNVEIASLGLYARNDVRRCLCWVNGGVYENMLFFPVIQLLRNRYPGIRIDVVAGERGKQAYEMNKYIERAIFFDTSAEWTVPGELTDFLGVLRGQYYDLILSTKYAGFKHSATLFMIGGRTRKVSYVPKYHSEWVSNHLLTEYIEAPRENLADGGYNMYEEMLSYVAQPGYGVPVEPIPPLQIGVPKRVRSVVKEKMNKAGVSEGKFVVYHGIESDSAASMTSTGDTDSLLPLDLWGQLHKELQGSTGGNLQPVVVIPHQKEREKVFEAFGQDVSVIFITTPGQLASLIRDSAGVISTNTAAMLMAVAFQKPSVALFGSAEKASLFVPPQAEKIKVVASKTGDLEGLDVNETVSACRSVFERQLALAS